MRIPALLFRFSAWRLFCAVVLLLHLIFILIYAVPGLSGRQNSVSGIAAMTHPMCITPPHIRQTGDKERVHALIRQIKAAIEKYKDYRRAFAHG